NRTKPAGPCTKQVHGRLRRRRAGVKPVWPPPPPPPPPSPGAEPSPSPVRAPTAPSSPPTRPRPATRLGSGAGLAHSVWLRPTPMEVLLRSGKPRSEPPPCYFLAVCPWVKLKDEEEESLDEEDGEWTEEVQRLQEQQLRAELLQQYQSLVAERGHCQRYNIYLQHKISEALRKKKGPDAAPVPDKGPEPEPPGKEQAYLRSLAMLEELRKQRADDLDWYHQELEQLKREGTEELARVEREWRAFQALKKQVMVQATGGSWTRGGRQAALRQVEQIQALEDKKEKEMSALRLENVQLKQSLVHFETRMRAQEDLTEGLLLIDFEQLKIENQTLNEKAEERNEELLKLRNKVTHNVQIVTHVKEKLHFVDLQNACKKSQLLETEAQVALRRDILTKTKKARDGLRIDNIKLNQKCGLLGKEPLLCDLEDKVDKAKLLRQRLESLKRHHARLVMSCRGVKQKMREAKAFLPS
uniref:CCDC113/CCDC96 coiled-coil domain-containing protein n=1 Tax=Panthera tigris altaica TaxID=74533 RepID=A0A8C9JA31_PANTA